MSAREATNPEIWLPAREVATLLRASPRTVRNLGARGKLPARRQAGNGGEQYAFALSGLPGDAQARYLVQAFPEVASNDEKAGAGARPLRPDLWRSRREDFESLPASMKAEARRRSQAVERLEAMMATQCARMQCFGQVAEEFGESTSTLRRWHKAVKGQEPGDWYLFLAPAYKTTGAPRADMHPDAWEYIKAQWLVQSQPALVAVVRRAQIEAKRQGWGDLPSVKTIQRRLEREVPNTLVAFKREGLKALERLHPAIQRDFSTLGPNDLWESDGRKADVFVVFPDGEVRRPIVMAIRDVRTRLVLGYAIGKTESEALIRLAMRNTLVRTNAVARELLVDNGRGYASKGFTGGQPTRYRFHVNEDDVLGVTTMLGIHVVWATPGHGQAKPIESSWRNIAETDKRAEFAGAYCGNKPDAKPEEFDARKAVPLQQYAAAVAEDFDAFNRRPHRGDSMDGRSPLEVYEELMAVTVCRRPTAEQVRMCLQAAEKKSLNLPDQSVTILGNRYWDEALAKLHSRGPYTVRFNPEDAREPVAVYDGERFICEARLQERTGFRDQEAAKRSIRARRDMAKGTKLLAKGLADDDRARRWDTPSSPAPAAPGDAVAGAPRLAELVIPAKRFTKTAGELAPEDGNAIDFDAAMAKGLRKKLDASAADDLPPPRMAGGW